MMRLSVLARLSLAALAAAACQPQTPAPAPPGEGTLVVMLVVDQLRPDLLHDYDTLYTGGLRRLLDEGFRFTSATHDHASTETAPGHTTLATGVYPTRHGIVGNTWFVRDGDGWRGVYSMADPESPILGHPEMSGRSAASIWRPGLADWIVERDGDARVVSISKKDRAAIGLAALARGEVYWLAGEAGVFVTSTYYRGDYPGWITDFNQRVMPEIYADTLWQSIVPPEARALTRPDTSRWELDGVHSAFPHRPADTGDEGSAEGHNLWRFDYTPFPDRAVVELTMEAIRALDLGRRGTVDYLGVALSQVDLVGHRFGPGSREQLDNLLRLDAELGRLLDFFDEAVGPGRWLLAFSSDHGVLEIPEHLAEQGVPAERLNRAHRQQLLDAIQAGMVAWTGQEPVEESIERSVAALPFVAGAYTYADVESATPPDSFAALMAKSHSRERAVDLAERWGVYVRYQPNFLTWSAAPATHGSPYYYDRHVPLIFLGAGIAPGVSDERVATVDAAPTLAGLAGVAAPGDLDGRSLEPLLSR
ncbi:MAG TPA: alkaline phosphatase family protein [Longimicrobiales bacterium]|nr:alkaline phosphatase family protein [Longimicrobiales bacterium]